MTGRTLAIGDVHGCYRALVTLLDHAELTASDTVVFLGDVVDRGADSKLVIDRILSLKNECRVIFITGNHEEMMINAIASQEFVSQWVKVGGQATLDSYDGSLECVPPEHIRFLVSGKSYWEYDSAILVHASIESNVSLVNQSNDFLRWKYVNGVESPHMSGKRVICGHTSQPDGVPLVFDGWVCIDTFAYGGKWLSCLILQTDHVIQANQNGEVREFPLPKYP